MSTDPFRLLSNAVEANDFYAFCAIYNPLEKEKGISFHRHKGLCYQALRLDRVDFFNHIYTRFKKSTEPTPDELMHPDFNELFEPAFEELFEGILSDRDLDLHTSLGHLIDANGLPSESVMAKQIDLAWHEGELGIATFLINKFNIPKISAESFSKHAIRKDWNFGLYTMEGFKRVVQDYKGSPLELSKLTRFLVALPELELNYLDLCKLLSKEDAISAFAGMDHSALKSLTKPERGAYGR